MKRWVRTLLPLLVPTLSAIYGVGEFFQWWDVLSGRHNAKVAYERFASNKNYPTIFIKDDESEFENLYHFINTRTAAEEVKKFHSEIVAEPSVCTRDLSNRVYLWENWLR